MRLNLWLLTSIIIFGISHRVFSQVDQDFLPKVTDCARIYASVVQSDGKILVAGEMRTIGDIPVQSIQRLNPDGSLDNTFKSPMLPHGTLIYSIVLDKDGKIIIGGAISSMMTSLSIAMRLNPDGTKDESFTLSPEINQPVIKIISLSDGSYLIASFSYKRIVKVRSDGSLDPSFDTGSGPDALGLDYLDIGVQDDGKIVVAGVFDNFNNVPANKVVRLNANGSIDDTFSAGSGPAGYGIRSIALDGDKIILVGTFNGFNSTSAKNIVRILSTGAVDPDFIYPGPSANYYTTSISQVALHSGGILIAGVKYENGELKYGLMKLKPDGSIDAAFPVVEAEVSVNASTVEAPVLTTSASAILFSGYFDKVDGVVRQGIVLLNEDGSIVETFNPAIGGTATVQTLTVQADGKVLIGGTFNHVNGFYINNLARLNADGSVDESFCANLGSGFNRDVTSIEILPDGKLLIAGTFDKFNDTHRIFLVRLNGDGTIDETFLPAISQKYIGVGISTMLVLPSGKIVIGGGFDYNNGYNLARLDVNGNIDTGFNVAVLNQDEHVNTVAMQSSGHLLIGGAQYPNQGGFLKKLSMDGEVVNQFETLDLTGRAVRIIKVLENDDFLMSGYPTTSFSSTTPYPLFQFNNEGELTDMLSIAVYGGQILDIHQLDNDNFILAGTFHNVNSASIKSLAKVKLNGSVEMSFDYAIDGYLQALVKENSDDNSYYVMGLFDSIGLQPSFNVARLNLDVPFSPEDLDYTIDNVNGKITLMWTDKSPNESGFHIFRSDGTGYIAIDSVGENTTLFIDSTAAPIKEYTYKVGAFTSKLQSSFSNEIHVSTSAWVPPMTPEKFNYLVSNDYNAIELTWVDASGNENGFELERSLDGAEFTLHEKIESDVETFSDELVFGSLLRYRLRAFNKFGASGYTEVLELPIITGSEDDKLPNVRAYPNPTLDKIWITVKQAIPLDVTVHDLRGRLQQRKTGREGTMEVDLTEAQKGVYFVRIGNGKRFKIFKVIKL